MKTAQELRAIKKSPTLAEALQMLVDYRCAVYETVAADTSGDPIAVVDQRAREQADKDFGIEIPQPITRKVQMLSQETIEECKRVANGS